MRKLTMFNHVSVDGYYCDAQSDMSWAHAGPDDAEYNAYVQGNASGDGVLVFGRRTYEMMAGFWPTPAAAAREPLVAERMNRGKKLVYSRSMTSAAWANTTLLGGDLAAGFRALKEQSGPPMTILGSGQLVAGLTAAGLIDEYSLLVNPLVLGSGRSLFAGLPAKRALTLTKARAFGNGKVLLCYAAS